MARSSAVRDRRGVDLVHRRNRTTSANSRREPDIRTTLRAVRFGFDDQRPGRSGSALGSPQRRFVRQPRAGAGSCRRLVRSPSGRGPFVAAAGRARGAHVVAACVRRRAPSKSTAQSHDTVRRIAGRRFTGSCSCSLPKRAGWCRSGIRSIATATRSSLSAARRSGLRNRPESGKHCRRSHVWHIAVAAPGPCAFQRSMADCSLLHSRPWRIRSFWTMVRSATPCSR